jgi:hypothetical protein
MIRAVLLALLAGSLIWLAWLFIRRAQSRQRARDQADEAEHETHARLNAARQKPGGSPENPIHVPTPAVVKPRAESHKCPNCDGHCRLEDHLVMHHSSGSLRVAQLECKQCGIQHELFFKIAQVN